jgi:hypothetical protein
VAAHLERFGRARRVFLAKQRRVLELRDLGAPPGELGVVEAVQAGVAILQKLEKSRPYGDPNENDQIFYMDN